MEGNGPLSGPDGEPEVLVPVPAEGRLTSRHRPVRLGDVSPRGRLRLDALARYLQDVANDDARTAGIADPDSWVVRRTTLAVVQPAVLAESLTLTTFCSGTGASWAERRTRLVGDHGALVEAASLWVQVDVRTGRPRRLDATFQAVYGPSAAGRVVSARLRHPETPDSGAVGEPFPLRFTDFDPFGHVNNAVYWAMVEEVSAASDRFGASIVATLEYRRPLERGASVELRTALTEVGGRGPMLALWVVDGAGVAATAQVRRYSSEPST